MADKTKKNSRNATGPYYVDNECIGCGMCHEIAGDYFKFDDDEGIAYVIKQPVDDNGKDLCNEAANSCPVEAIGNDGE